MLHAGFPQVFTGPIADHVETNQVLDVVVLEEKYEKDVIAIAENISKLIFLNGNCSILNQISLKYQSAVSPWSLLKENMRNTVVDGNPTSTWKHITHIQRQVSRVVSTLASTYCLTKAPSTSAAASWVIHLTSLKLNMFLRSWVRWYWGSDSLNGCTNCKHTWKYYQTL